MIGSVIKKKEIAGHKIEGISKTPEERLQYLQKEFNSQDGEIFDYKLKLKMKALFDEMMEIIELYPNIAPIELKEYTPSWR